MQNKRKTTIESNLKVFARSESDCTLRLGLSSLIKHISNTRQSNLLLHFFKMLNVLLRSLGAEECLTRKC